jgi:predicted HAD superfamily Cof-like phosphohydrolase
MKHVEEIVEYSKKDTDDFGNAIEKQQQIINKVGEKSTLLSKMASALYDMTKRFKTK